MISSAVAASLPVRSVVAGSTSDTGVTARPERPLNATAAAYWAKHDTIDTIDGPMTQEAWNSLSREERVGLIKPPPADIQLMFWERRRDGLVGLIEAEERLMEFQHFQMRDEGGFLAYLETAVPEIEARIAETTGPGLSELIEERRALTETLADRRQHLTRLAEEWPAVKAAGESRIAALREELAALQARKPV